jgi:hypothetical protein
MKRNFLLLVFVLSSFTVRSQVLKSMELVNFKLYPTENIYNFLKLDTRDGTITQVQWSLEFDTRFEYSLSDVPLVEGNERVVNRFALYPTQNSYTFVLLDQISGQTWQVQWSTNRSERFVQRIDYYDI